MVRRVDALHLDLREAQWIAGQITDLLGCCRECDDVKDRRELLDRVRDKTAVLGKLVKRLLEKC